MLSLIQLLSLADAPSSWGFGLGLSEVLYLAAALTTARLLGLWMGASLAALGAASGFFLPETSGFPSWSAAPGHSAALMTSAIGLAVVGGHLRNMCRRLTESKEAFDLFMRNLPGPAYIKDHQGRVIYANDFWRRVFPKALGSRSENLIGDDEAAKIYALELQVLETGQPGQLVQKISQPAGERWYLMIRFRMTETGPADAQLGVVGVDITQQKEIEEALLANRRRLRQLTADLQTAEDRERQHLATSLHDEVGQPLCLAKLKLDQLGCGAAMVQQIGSVRELVAEALEQARNLCSELRPALHAHATLAQTLNWLAERMRLHQGLDVQVRGETDTLALGRDLEAFVLRAIRELLVNVAKHAEARQATVELATEGGDLVVRVCDDGKGFDPTHLEPGGSDGRGMGLFGIQERVAALNGSMSIEAAHHRGAAITLRLPLEAENGTRDTVESVVGRRS